MTEKRSTEEVMYWRGVWINALSNMPYIRADRHGLGYYGQQSALGYCLGYAEDVHQGVWSGYCGCSKPKGKRADALLKLAGPYGQLFARMKLKRLGILHRYPHWK